MLLYAYSGGSPPCVGIYCGGPLGAHAVSISGNTLVGAPQPMNGIVIAKGSYGLIAQNMFRNVIDTGIWLQAGANHFHGQDNLIVTPPRIQGLLNQGTANSITML